MFEPTVVLPVDEPAKEAEQSVSHGQTAGQAQLAGPVTLDPGSSKVSRQDETNSAAQRALAGSPSPEGAGSPKDTIRAHFDQVRNQYSVSKGQKRLKKGARFQGAKPLYRSIERPLNVYTRPMDVIDVTDATYRRDARRLRKLQRMYAKH